MLAGCGDETANPTTTGAAARSAAGTVQKVTTGQAVRARLGTTFVVSLREQPATGYRWEAAGGSAAGTVVDPVGTAEVPVPDNPDPDAASPGRQISREFTYTAVKQGRGTLRFEYSRPWEDKPINTKTFDVMVTG